jgi:hypothetical protein
MRLLCSCAVGAQVYWCALIISAKRRAIMGATSGAASSAALFSRLRDMINRAALGKRTAEINQQTRNTHPFQERSSYTSRELVAHTTQDTHHATNSESTDRRHGGESLHALRTCRRPQPGQSHHPAPPAVQRLEK